MHQLRPGENFPIRRQLDDPTDVSTYYMRAVLRWADDDTIVPVNGVNYVNMTNGGSQRFRASVQVPADRAGGLGSYLIITTTVYTDAAYTTVADNYRIEEQTYLVFDRKNPYLGMGGGSGVNYDTVRKLIGEELDARKPEKAKATDLKPILTALDDLKQAVTAFKVPEPKEVSLEPVLARIGAAEQAVKAAIGAIHIPQPEKLDLTPVTSRLDKLDPELYQSKMDMLFDRVKKFLGGDIDEVKTILSSIESAVTDFGKRFKAMLKAAEDEPANDQQNGE